MGEICLLVLIDIAFLVSDWRSDTKSKGDELDRVIKIGDRLGKIIVQSLEARTDFKTENRGRGTSGNTDH